MQSPVEDRLDKLDKIFSTLDLNNRIFHVLIDEENWKYSGVIVPDGQYEFLKVLFKLCNS